MRTLEATRNEILTSRGPRARPCAPAIAAIWLAASLGPPPAALADGQTLTWSDVDTLTQVTTPEGTTSFAYDGDGQRVSKTDPAGKRILYIRDASGNLIAAYDKTTGEYTDYVYLGARRVASVSDSGERRYYHGDQVGTPLVVTDSSGEAVWRGESLPFGEEALNSDPEQDDTLKFTGKELDDATGLHYFGARYYDARLGRFISADPAEGLNEKPQTLNRYTYSLDNPITIVDPDGRFPFDVGWAVVKATLSAPEVVIGPMERAIPYALSKGGVFALDSMFLEGAPWTPGLQRVFQTALGIRDVTGGEITLLEGGRMYTMREQRARMIARGIVNLGLYMDIGYLVYLAGDSQIERSRAFSERDIDFSLKGQRGPEDSSGTARLLGLTNEEYRMIQALRNQGMEIKILPTQTPPENGTE